MTWTPDGSNLYQRIDEASGEDDYVRATVVPVATAVERTAGGGWTAYFIFPGQKPITLELAGAAAAAGLVSALRGLADYVERATKKEQP